MRGVLRRHRFIVRTDRCGRHGHHHAGIDRFRRVVRRLKGLDGRDGEQQADGDTHHHWCKYFDLDLGANRMDGLDRWPCVGKQEVDEVGG